MKKINLIIALLLVLQIQALHAAVADYRVSIFNDASWQKYDLLDNGINGDVTAGDGIFSCTQSISVTNAYRVYWYVVNPDGAILHTSWLHNPTATTSILFTFDTNIKTDGWLPTVNSPNSNEAVSQQGPISINIDAASTDDAMKDGGVLPDTTSGDGIFTYKKVISVAGEHKWFAYHDGEDKRRWDAAGKHEGADNANPDTIVFVTTADNQVAYFYLNITTGRVRTIITEAEVGVYSLSVSAINGSITKSPDKTLYVDGETVALTAMPDAGYEFDSWGGDASGSTTPVIITMNEDKTVTANFTESTSDLPIAGNWDLTFSEEFDGDMLHPDKWRIGGHWLGSTGLGGNSTDNIAVTNGNLEVTAEKRSITFGGKAFDYACGEISTFKQFRQLYGYYEARVKYDAIKGMWPAFWTMPNRATYGTQSLVNESYIKFDISDVSEPITSVILKIKVIDANSKSNIAVHELLSNNWDETTITGNTKPQYNPAWIIQLSGTSQVIEGGYLEIDVTSEVKAQVAAGYDIGFALVDNFGQDSKLKLGSKENGTATNRPYLVIDGTEKLPSDDAYVSLGSRGNTNYGSEVELWIKDPWARTSSTSDGGMEFDVMETLGIWGDNKNQHAIHWDGYGDDHQHTGSGTKTLTPTGDGYHVYAMHWQPGKLDFYTDNTLTWTYTNERVGSVASHILLSLQVGGWGGNADITDIDGKMYVDYVRVYKEGAAELVSVIDSSKAAVAAQSDNIGYAIGEYSSATIGSANAAIATAEDALANATTQTELDNATQALRVAMSLFAPNTVESYTLNISADFGSVTKLPNKPIYTDGETVTLTAVPSSGYVFGEWSGDASGSVSPLIITMDKNKSIVANFIKSSSEDLTNARVINYVIFPNPSTGEISVIAKDILYVEIYNILGERIIKTAESKNINLSNQAKGIYFVRTTTIKGEQTSRFILE